MITNCPFCNKKLFCEGRGRLACYCGKNYVEYDDAASFKLNDANNDIMFGNIQFYSRELIIRKNYSKVILSALFENDDHLIEILKNINLYLAFL